MAVVLVFRVPATISGMITVLVLDDMVPRWWVLFYDVHGAKWLHRGVGPRGGVQTRRKFSSSATKLRVKRGPFVAKRKDDIAFCHLNLYSSL